MNEADLLEKKHLPITGKVGSCLFQKRAKYIIPFDFNTFLFHSKNDIGF